MTTLKPVNRSADGHAVMRAWGKHAEPEVADMQNRIAQTCELLWEVMEKMGEVNYDPHHVQAMTRFVQRKLMLLDSAMRPRLKNLGEEAEAMERLNRPVSTVHAVNSEIMDDFKREMKKKYGDIANGW
jgi:hypothetical protein